ncbi:MAG: hypothetical protein Q8Q08_03915 [Candidatus Omnitrophota bacterium]|nr:hypothetical protein [Candidatus Omnitrophota bacterium]MDZ4242675.1 hypothetical protein [Candidatus Omnitrophota bacterium]
MRRNVRFSRSMNWWFYGIFGVLFFSGLFWLAAHYGGGEEADFDGKFYFFQSRLLWIHGAAAMASLVVLGALIPTHMQRAWEAGKNRATAIAMLSLCGLMVLTGYGLYYSGSETVRSWMSGFHSIAGCLLPPALVWHIVSGRSKRAHVKK